MAIKSPIDVAVGARLRELRLQHGLDSARIAARLEVSEGRLLRFESGAERIEARILAAISRIFSVPISSFFAVPQTQSPMMEASILPFPSDGRRRKASGANSDYDSKAR